jgi:hypothetical protein
VTSMLAGQFCLHQYGVDAVFFDGRYGDGVDRALWNIYQQW